MGRNAFHSGHPVWGCPGYFLGRLCIGDIAGSELLVSRPIATGGGCSLVRVPDGQPSLAFSLGRLVGEIRIKAIPQTERQNLIPPIVFWDVARSDLGDAGPLGVSWSCSPSP